MMQLFRGAALGLCVASACAGAVIYPVQAQQATAQSTPQATAQPTPQALAQTAPQEPAQSTPQAPAQAAAPPSSSTGNSSPAIEPNLVVDVNDLVARAPPRITCRELLRPGSNVLTRQCMTAENWKRYERLEAEAGQELVRTMQRGRYR